MSKGGNEANPNPKLKRQCFSRVIDVSRSMYLGIKRVEYVIHVL